MNTSLAKNYAEALYSISLEKDNYLDIQKEMKLLKEVILENQEFTVLLCSSFMSFKEKEDIIDKVLSEFDEDIKSLVKILVKNSRGNLLEQVIDDFNTFVNEKRGILEGYVYSTYPLTKSQLTKLEEKIGEIEQVPCELKNKIDANLIGGVKVAINGHVYDGSIKTKIEQMRLSLNK